MKRLLYIYRLLMPEWFRDNLYVIRCEIKDRRLNKPKIKRNIIEAINSFDSPNQEILDVRDYLLNNELKAIPMNLHSEKNIEVKKENGMYYVDVLGKKMFFPKDRTKKAIISYCEGIFEEQHPDSPHSYLSSKFQINKDSILADIGAAEGYFSLMVIDKVKKIYIFEADKDWYDALHKTFEPWKEKVEIVFTTVADINDDTHSTLDKYFSDRINPNFIKMDVEGYEEQILKGANKTLNEENMKVAICTYHRHNDDKKFEDYFQKLGYKTHFSNSYMLIYFMNEKDFQYPYLRRGVLRAEK